LNLTDRLDELKKEYEKNREIIKESEKRQLIIEYELTALKTLARDLLSHGIEDIEL